MLKYIDKAKIEEELDLDTQSNLNFREHIEEHQSLKSLQLPKQNRVNKNPFQKESQQNFKKNKAKVIKNEIPDNLFW